MVFGEDFLLPLKSLASLYHRVEESHLEEGEYIKNSILCEFLNGIHDSPPQSRLCSSIQGCFACKVNKAILASSN